MGLPLLLFLFGAAALVVHVARYWRPLAFLASVGATLLLVWAVRGATSLPFDFFGVTFELQPLARDYLLTAVLIAGSLAIATSFGETRRTLGFFFWSWTAWLVALLVNDFVIGVFAWATGLAAMVLAMEPRRLQRVGGAAYFLVLIIIASAALLVGNRFLQLYPLTPDQLSLVASSVLFLTWGLGILLAVVPFMLWLGPMADETPLAIIAVLLGLGQPIGLWLLYGLVGQYPRLLEASNLLAVLGYGGITAILVGGSLGALERRAGRYMSYAALYVLGFVLLDLSRGTLEGTAFAVVETFARAIGLAMIAASLTIANAVESRRVQFAAIPVFLLGALALAGLAPGISFASRWNLLLELEITDRRIFALTMLATLGILIGAARFVKLWLHQLIPMQAEPGEYAFIVGETVPPNLPRIARARRWARTRLEQLARRGAAVVPAPLRPLGSDLIENWRVIFAVTLLVVLAAFFLYYSATPQIWFDRALETVSQLAFLR